MQDTIHRVAVVQITLRYESQLFTFILTVATLTLHAPKRASMRVAKKSSGLQNQVKTK